MAGPTCDVQLRANADGATLDVIDAFVKRSLENVRETRKGRHWAGALHGRVFTVNVVDASEISPAAVCFAAPSNSTLDFETLHRLSIELAKILGGVATEPTN